MSQSLFSGNLRSFAGKLNLPSGSLVEAKQKENADTNQANMSPLVATTSCTPATNGERQPIQQEARTSTKSRKKKGNTKVSQGNLGANQQQQHQELLLNEPEVTAVSSDHVMSGTLSNIPEMNFEEPQVPPDHSPASEIPSSQKHMDDLFESLVRLTDEDFEQEKSNRFAEHRAKIESFREQLMSLAERENRLLQDVDAAVVRLRGSFNHCLREKISSE